MTQMKEQAPKVGKLRGGWTPVYHEVWSHYLPAIGKDALIFYLYLLNYRNTSENNPRYGKAWPGRKRVATELAISPKQLPKIDRMLEAVRLVEIERVACGSGRPRIQYIVNDPLPVEELDIQTLKDAVSAAQDEAKSSEGKRANIPEGSGFDSQGNMIKNYLSISTDQELKDSTPMIKKNIDDYNAKDIATHFSHQYFRAYGDVYGFVYKRELPMIKTKLLDVYGARKSIQIIDAAFVLYPDKWRKPGYERPSIGWLASWGAGAVVAAIGDTLSEIDQQPAPPSASSTPTTSLDDLAARGLI